MSSDNLKALFDNVHMSNGEPCGHRVLVRLMPIKAETEEKTESGIVFAIKDKKTANAEKHAVQKAQIVSLGENAFKIFGDGNRWAEIGDVVLISKYTGEDEYDSAEEVVYRVINDEDVLMRWRAK